MLKIYKKNLIIFAFVLISMSLQAQISLTATGGTLSGTYTTLGAAFTAINSGTHTGTISISVTGNTTEPVSAILNASGNGSASYTSIQIVPGGGASRTISGNIAGALIDLNGSDNITIDGLNTGGNALIIDNSNTGTTTSTIRFINDASTNQIQNCTILGASTSISTGTIFFGNADATLLQGNDNNTINNCTFDGSGVNLPSSSIVCIGTAVNGQENNNISITNNRFTNFFSATIASSGISVSSGGTAWTINGNRFYQTATRTYTVANTHSAIRTAAGDSYTIQGNIIGFASSAGTGTYTMTSTLATRFIGIDLSSGTIGSSVQGNTITAINLTTSSGAATTNGIICGIRVSAGNASIGNITGNIIGATTGTGSISATPTTTQGSVVGININSTGVIDIQNNTIASMTSSGATPAVAGGVYGITVSAICTSINISNNTFGNATANSMQAGTNGLTTGSSIASGIHLASTPLAVNINNNNIQNFSSFGTGTAGYVRGIWTAAATGSTVVFNITNNTISNLTSNSGLTTITSGQAGAVGINLGIGNNSIISGNTIFNISRSNTGLISGFSAGIINANATSTTITKNLIYGISNLSTAVSTTAPGIAAGIIIRSGTTDVTVTNNMISLGNGQTTNTCFIGIQGNYGSTPDPVTRIYHNTVNIEGTATAGAQPSFCFLRGDLSATARTVSVDILNNIFTNSRIGGTGFNFAIANNYGATASATGWPVNASNYNVLNAAAATVGFWSANQTFASWKTTSSSDANSFSGISVIYVNSANNLHLNMGLTATSIECGGTTIPSVVVDYDNQNRPGPTGSVNGYGLLPDIGADEFDGVGNDINGPIISYTALLNYSCDLTDRTFTANIFDLTGVPTSGSLVPRVYFRKNAGAWFSNPGVFVSGNARNGNWSFTISTAAMGGLVTGDVVSYYVIAQDIVAIPYISSNPAAGLVATDVNTVTTAPTTPNSYTTNTLSGVYTVGLTGNYATITAAVNAYNNSCISGPVTFQMIDATYPSETFPITINSNIYASSVNTLTIRQASGVVSTISGTSATAIFILNGADFVTIDGGDGTGTNSICPRSNATRTLTMTNTSTSTASAVISLQTTASGDGARNNKLINCNIIGNGSLTTGVAINISGLGIGSGTGALLNSNNEIINNSIRQAQVGIYSVGSALSKNSKNIYNLNDITGAGATAIGRFGIMLFNEDSISVQGNQIANITNNTTNDVVGISLGYNSGSNINTTAGGEITNATVSHNEIKGIVQTNTYSSVGLNIAAASNGTTTVYNNIISGIFANGTSPDFAAGIYHGGGTGTLKIYNNTVEVNGTALTGGTQPSFALAINGTTPSVDIKNNILICNGSTGANLNTGIGLAYTSTVGNYLNLLSNNNNIFVSGTGAAVGRVGGLSTTFTARALLTDWQTETGRDLNSFNINPVFLGATNLRLDAANATNSPLFCGGTYINSITNDIDCNSRLNILTPTIGANETPKTIPSITLAETSGIANNDGIVCVGSNVELSSSGNSFSWSGPNSFTSTLGNINLSNVSNLNSGIYTATVTTGSCLTQSFTTITVNNNPTATIAGINTVCSGASSTFTASGGTNYLWSTGATTSAINVSTAQTYTVTVSDANACTASTSSALTVNTNPTAIISGTNTICSGASSTFTASGGTNYLWSTGATTAAISVSTAQTYTVTVSDANSCTATTSSALTVNTNPTAAIAGNNTICSGASSTFTASGGTNYLWSTGATTAAISVSTAQTYTVTVSDANACTASTSSALTVNTNPTAAITGTNTICSSANSTFTASGGTNYLWSTGATTAAISVSTAQTYTVTVSDANACTASTSSALTVNTNPTAIISGTNTICSGANSTFTASGGTNYLWSTGATTAAINVSTAQTYTVTVSDANSCTATTTRAITVNTNPIATITGTNTICSGANSTFTASGGTNYLWSTGATTAAISVSTAQTYTVTVSDANACTASTSSALTVNTNPTAAITGTNTICSSANSTFTASGGTNYLWSTGATTAAISVSTAQTYTVTVSDANACTASTSSALTVNTNPTAIISGTNTICSGASSTFTASGGTNYLWSTGATTSAINVSNAQTYTVTVSDANACTATTSSALTVNTNPTATISVNNAICSGASTTFTASGGTNYLWSTGETTAAISVSTAQTYSVTVSDANNCTATNSSTLIVNTNPTATIVGVNTICSGANTTFSASGGSSFIWSTGATTAAISVSTAQNYTVTISDVNGCTATASSTLTVNTNPTATIAGTNAICFSASSTFTASGGTNYLWSTGATTAAINVSTAQTYTVTVSDVNSCSATSTRALTVNTNPTATIAGNNTICFGASSTFTASGGTNYLWSTGATTAAINVSTAQNYNVTVSDANACTATTTSALTVNTNPTATIAGTNAICSGASSTFTASGGTNYIWSTGATTAAINVSTAQTYTVTVSDANSCTASTTSALTVNTNPTAAIIGVNTICSGASSSFTASGGTSYIWSTGATTAAINVSTAQTYTVTVSDANSCSATSTRALTVNTNPTATIAGTNTICSGAISTFTASGGTNYIWSTGATTAAINVSTAQTYTVTVSDANNCTASTSSALTVNANPTATIAGTNAICSGASSTFTASGGTNYLWSTGATTAAISVSTAQTYTVTVSDANACTATTSSALTVNTNPTAAITGNNTICSGANTTFSASGGSSFIWSTGATTAAISVSTAQNYTVTISDVNGCTATASSTLTVNANPTATIAGTNTICSGAISTFTASGGNNYIWSTGATTAAINVSTAQTYTVTVSDANNCTATTSSALTVNANPTAAIVGSNTICSGASSTFTASGGNNYIWSTGATTAAINVSTAQTYTVTVSDANSCTATTIRVLTVNANPTATIATNNISCAGLNNGSATVNILGGNSPFNYIWTNASTSATVSGLSSGFYTVTTSDNNGCTATASTTITEPAAISISTGSTNSICTASNGAAIVNASGGTTPLSFLWSNGETVNNIINITANTYSVTVSDANACTVIATVIVNSNPVNLSVSLTSNDAVCTASNGRATASTNGGTAPYSYLWSNGASSSINNGLSTGSYSVTITDNNGCSASNNITVNQNPGNLSGITSVSNALCLSSNGSALAAGIGGTLPYSFIWDNGATTASINGLAPGFYDVTIIDANGCTQIESVSVGVNSNPITILASVDNASSPNATDGTIDLSVIGGSAPYVYNWSSGQSQQDLIGLAPGTYTITVNDANGCESVQSFTVVSPTSTTEEMTPEWTSNLYPNPAEFNSLLEISFVYNSDVRIRMYNSVGQLIQSAEYTDILELRHTLDVAALPSAVYYVEILSGNKVKTYRLVVGRK